MSAEQRAALAALIEKGDHYGLMLLAVAQWIKTCHPDAIRGAVYVIEEDDAEPTRIRIPLSAYAA